MNRWLIKDWRDGIPANRREWILFAVTFAISLSLTLVLLTWLFGSPS